MQRKKREIYEIDQAIIADNAAGDSLKMNFATGLNRLLSQKGIDQGVFAKEVGISTGAVSNYRNGKKLPDTKKIVRIANYLGVDTHYLLTGVPAKYANIGAMGLSGSTIESIENGFVDPCPEYPSEFSRVQYLDVFNRLISHPKFSLILDSMLILEQHCSMADAYEYQSDDRFFWKRGAYANRKNALESILDIQKTLKDIKSERYEIAETILDIITDTLNIEKHKRTMEDMSHKMYSFANAADNAETDAEE